MTTICLQLSFVRRAPLGLLRGARAGRPAGWRAPALPRPQRGERAAREWPERRAHTSTCRRRALKCVRPVVGSGASGELGNRESPASNRDKWRNDNGRVCVAPLNWRRSARSRARPNRSPPARPSRRPVWRARHAAAGKTAATEPAAARPAGEQAQSWRAGGRPGRGAWRACCSRGAT